MKKTFNTPAASFDTVVVNGSIANVDVRTSENLTGALIEITGPEELIRDAHVDLIGTRWVLEFPETNTSTVISAGDATVVSTGTGSVIIQAGKINGVVASGDVTITRSGKTTVISGDSQTITPDQQVRVAIRVPQGTNLRTQLTSGSLTTGHARLGAVHHVSTSGDANVGSVREISAETRSGMVIVRTVTGLSTIRTRSGGIGVHGGTRADLESREGTVHFAADRDCRVDAATRSGDIILSRYSHTVDSRIRTRSGSVRER